MKLIIKPAPQPPPLLLIPPSPPSLLLAEVLRPNTYIQRQPTLVSTCVNSPGSDHRPPRTIPVPSLTDPRYLLSIPEMRTAGKRMRRARSSRARQGQEVQFKAPSLQHERGGGRGRRQDGGRRSCQIALRCVALRYCTDDKVWRAWHAYMYAF